MATTLADTLETIVPFLQPLATAAIGVSRSSPQTAATVQAAMTSVQDGLTALAASQTAAQSKPLVERIEAGGMAVLNAAASAPLPFPYSMILMIASGMLPTLISSVNLLLAHKVDVTALPSPLPAAA